MVDYLHGFIDIHNHILPGIDDGAKTVEESVALIEAFSAFGVTNFVFTPHIMNHYHPNTQKTIKSSYEVLQQELLAREMDNIRTAYAAEHMIDDAFEVLLEEKTFLPLKKWHVLIEMSYLQPSFNFGSAVEQIKGHNYFPILAHPERYMYYHQKEGIYKDLKSDGILFQLNLLSLSGYYGAEIQRIAQKLLGDGLIDFCASDVHNMKHIQGLKETKLTSKTLNQILPIIENTIKTFY